jgi:hypothetical protein
MREWEKNGTGKRRGEGRRARTEAGGGAEEGAEDGVVVGGDVRAVDAARLDRVVLVRVEHSAGAPSAASPASAAHSHLASASASCYCLPTNWRRRWRELAPSMFRRATGRGPDRTGSLARSVFTRRVWIL